MDIQRLVKARRFLSGVRVWAPADTTFSRTIGFPKMIDFNAEISWKQIKLNIII